MSRKRLFHGTGKGTGGRTPDPWQPLPYPIIQLLRLNYPLYSSAGNVCAFGAVGTGKRVLFTELSQPHNGYWRIE